MMNELNYALLLTQADSYRDPAYSGMLKAKVPAAQGDITGWRLRHWPMSYCTWPDVPI